MSRDVGQFADNLVWRMMGFRLLAWTVGRTDVGWDAPLSCCIQAQGGPIVRGGLLTGLLDAAAAAACWSTLDAAQAFVTADMRIEFLHPCRPGDFVATGTVNRRKREVVQCEAELRSADGLVCVTAKSTQLVVPAEGTYPGGGPEAGYGPDGQSPIVRG